MLDYLEENNLTDNTIIIYTADQGYFLGEHGMMDKRMFWKVYECHVIKYSKKSYQQRIDDIIE